jgi:hypothetical protein
VADGLAKALVDFQSRIGAIPRSKTVKVTSRKTGQTYTFDYAPHEAIIAAIQKPLGECGLAVSQQLASLPDGLPALRTILLHSSGERLDDLFPLPTAEGMTSQELGSTITYIRRYALSAILGLATEDDDDANAAAGNEATVTRNRPGPPDASGATEELLGIETFEGTVQIGGAAGMKLEVRQTPEGPAFGFRLDIGREKAIPQVVVQGDPAIVAIAGSGGDPAAMKGHWVRVKGKLYAVRQAGRTSFQRLRVSEIETHEWRYPPSQPAVQEASDAGTPEVAEPDGERTGSAATPDEDLEAWQAANPELGLLGKTQ